MGTCLCVAGLLWILKDACVHMTVSLIKLGSTEEGQLQVVCTTATYVERLQ